MKNLFKKNLILGLTIFVGVLALPFFASAATFNDNPRDYPTIEVRNDTSGGSWGSSVTANAGDTIAFYVYYHNTSDPTARQTRVNAILPTGAFTSSGVTGSVWAQNASTVSRNVTVNLTSSQTLTFIPGSVSWYANNQRIATSPLLGGQTGAEIVTVSGLNVGNISKGWPEQGLVMFLARVGSVGSTQAPLVTTNSATNVTQSSSDLQGSVNPNNSYTTAYFEWGTTPSLGNVTSTTSIGSGASYVNFFQPITGLSSYTTYYYRAVAVNSYGITYGSILSFTTGAYSANYPSVTTNTAMNISQSSADLYTTVNPNNSNTDVWFEWGNTASLGNTTSYYNAGSGNANISVSRTITGLSYNTTYYYRAVARNSYGTAYGSILTFSTSGGGTGCYAPIVSTQAASFIDQSSATLRGLVNPQNRPTTGWFEYGINYSLGSITSYQDIGSSSYDYDLLRYLTSLSANTTYYYRAAAQNGCGTSYGIISSFTTGTGTSQTGLPQLTLSSAAEITSTSVLLSGSANPKNSETTAWLEWGLGSTFVSYSSSSPLNVGTGDVIKSINARPLTLSPNTTYYFRAAAKNSYGTAYSPVLSFTTLSSGAAVSQPVQPVSSGQPSAPVSTSIGSSLMALEMNTDRETAAIGKNLTYSIIYRNTGIANTSNNVLKVILPVNVSLLDAGFSNYSLSGNVLSFNFGKLNKNDIGSLNVKVTVGNSAESGEKLTATAVLDFTNASGISQPSISAFASSEVGSAGFFGAAAAGIPFAGLPWWTYVLVAVAAVAFFARYKISKMLEI